MRNVALFPIKHSLLNFELKTCKIYFNFIHYRLNSKVGFKPAGGIRTSKDVLLWQELMAKELGNEWLYPNLFRIGASSLLGDIEQTIIQGVTGCVGKTCLAYL